MDGYFLLLCMVMCVVFLTKNNKIGPLHDEPLKTMKLFFWLFFFFLLIQASLRMNYK